MTQETKFHINYVSIISMSIKNFKGKESTILPYFIEMNIQEDLFLPAQYGTITLVDNVNFYEKFPIIGEEVLTITFKDYVHEPVTKEYFIYSVLERQNASDKGQMYTLEFCSEEILANKSQRYSKAYHDKEAHIIAQEAFDKLNSKKPFDIVQTQGLQDYVVPNLNPFDVISQMAARSITSKGETGSVLFFEDKDGFKFQSIESVMASEPEQYYIGDGSDVSLAKKYWIFNNYKFIAPVNNINNAIQGTHGVNVKTIDLFRRKLTADNSYDYFNDGQYTEINRVNSPNPDLRLSSKEYPYKSNNGMFKITVAPMEDSGKSTKNKTLSRRYNILSSFKNGPKIHAELAFNTDITIGKMIDVNMVSIDVRDAHQSAPGESDKYLNGKYLVTACRHLVKPGSALTIVELSKDSYTKSYYEGDN